MAEISQFLTPEGRLFNVKTVNFGNYYNEYVAFGVDPFSFKPMVFICNSTGDNGAYVSVEGKHIATFLLHLRTKLDYNGERSVGSINDSGITMAILDNYCRLEDECGNMVIISLFGACHLSRGIASEIIKNARTYIYAYHKHKPELRKFQLMVYEKYFAKRLSDPTYFYNLKQEACDEFHILNEYFGFK